MKSKLKHFLAGALLILPLVLQAFTGFQAVSAADGQPAPADSSKNQTVVLTKLVFPDGKQGTRNFLPSGDGKELTPDQLQGGQPLAGVEFSAYNVTNVTDKDALKNAKAAPDGAKQVGDPITTDKDGHATFNLPTVDAQGQYQTYLILETKYADPEVVGGKTIDNSAVIEASAPLILTMPLNTSKTGNKVYVYPKNFDKTTTTKDLSKPGDSTANLGDQLEYTITETIPFDIATRDIYTITDTPSKGLDDLANTVSVTDASGKAVTALGKAVATPAKAATAATDKTAATDASGAGFTLNGDIKQLSAYAGQTLTIKYKAQVNTSAVTTLNNKVTTDFSHNPHVVTGKTPVKVGGQKFIKQDASDATKLLPDAVFVLEDDKGNIVTTARDKDNNRITIPSTGLDVVKLSAAVEGKTGSEKKFAAIAELKSQLEKANPNAPFANAVVAISNDQGAFEFTGLKYGDYKAVELAAPKGYAVSTTATPFTVNDKSYTADPIKINNSPKGVLPHTGGMGIYLIIVAGLIVMAGAVFVLKKNRHDEV